MAPSNIWRQSEACKNVTQSDAADYTAKPDKANTTLSLSSHQTTILVLLNICGDFRDDWASCYPLM